MQKTEYVIAFSVTLRGQKLFFLCISLLAFSRPIAYCLDIIVSTFTGKLSAKTCQSFQLRGKVPEPLTRDFATKLKALACFIRGFFNKS
jgi:hypothetical protein